VSSVFNGRSGNWQNITTNLDIAGTGITAQRADQLSGDVYGPKRIINRLSRDALLSRSLAHTSNSIQDPGYSSVDVAPSRVANLVERPTLEILR
jgi:hypothetical protein